MTKLNNLKYHHNYAKQYGDTDIQVSYLNKITDYFDDFNARSIMYYINGVLQEPFVEYDFHNSRLYTNNPPAAGDKIFIRALAN